MILFLSLRDHELIALGPIVIHGYLFDLALGFLHPSLFLRKLIVVEKANLLRRVKYVVFLV